MFCKWRTMAVHYGDIYLFRIILYGNCMIIYEKTVTISALICIWPIESSKLHSTQSAWKAQKLPAKDVYFQAISAPRCPGVSVPGGACVRGSGVQTSEISAPSLQLREAADTRSQDKPTEHRPDQSQSPPRSRDTRQPIRAQHPCQLMSPANQRPTLT